MITLEFTDAATMEQQAVQAGLTLPIEQTAVWAKYQNTIDGRTPWGAYVVKQDGAPIAFIALIDYETHGYHYLRSVHGPAWLDKPSTQLEAQVRDLLVEDVRKRDKNVVFLRIDLWNFEGSFPVLSTVPYNETVYVDITGGDEAILTRMKKRGRRDVRKALRESPAVCADETAQAMADFSEYYEVMVDTANRDGFSPAPMSDYVDMISNLGPASCARIRGTYRRQGCGMVHRYHQRRSRGLLLCLHAYGNHAPACSRQADLRYMLHAWRARLHSARFNGHRQRFRAFIEESERIQDEILRKHRTDFRRSRHSGQEGILPFAHAAAVAASQTAQVIIAPHDG